MSLGSSKLKERRAARRAAERAQMVDDSEARFNRIVAGIPEEKRGERLARCAAFLAMWRLTHEPGEDAKTLLAAVERIAAGLSPYAPPARTARYDRSQLPVRGGLPRPIRGRRSEP